jgi:hypothetical protein
MRTRIREDLAVEHASLMAGVRSDVPVNTLLRGREAGPYKKHPSIEPDKASVKLIQVKSK